MSLLNYSLAALVAYLGLISGLMLSIVAKEELKAGRKYFFILQKVLLVLIFSILLVLRPGYLPIFLSVIFMNYLLVHKNLSSPMIYLFLAGVFYLSSIRLDIFIVEASLIFLYGFPTGSIVASKSIKESIMKISRYSSFVLLAIVLFLLAV